MTPEGEIAQLRRRGPPLADQSDGVPDSSVANDDESARSAPLVERRLRSSCASGYPHDDALPAANAQMNVSTRRVRPARTARRGRTGAAGGLGSASHFDRFAIANARTGHLSARGAATCVLPTTLPAEANDAAPEHARVELREGALKTYTADRFARRPSRVESYTPGTRRAEEAD